MSTSVSAQTPSVREGWFGSRWSPERRFHFLFALALLGAVFLGFSRTFFLRHWFPEWAAVHGAPEPFFYIHGAVVSAWFVLLLAQTSLIAARRVDLHRRLGRIGVALAGGIVLLGTIGSLMAARRATGFIDIPMPPLQFLVVPLGLMALFAGYVALAIAKRRDAQSHKRYMLLASISLIEAAVARWPFAFMQAALFPFLSPLDLAVDLFLVPMLIWDLMSRGRPHPVTVWGGLALILSHPLRFALAETQPWLSFAGWAVHLIGP